MGSVLCTTRLWMNQKDPMTNAKFLRERTLRRSRRKISLLVMRLLLHEVSRIIEKPHAVGYLDTFHPVPLAEGSI